MAKQTNRSNVADNVIPIDHGKLLANRAKAYRKILISAVIFLALIFVVSWRWAILTLPFLIYKLINQHTKSKGA